MTDKWITRPGGLRLHYDAHGTGTPMLAIHGLGSTARSFARLNAELTRNTELRTLAIDLRGYGHSDDAPPTHSWSTFADDLQAVLDAETHPAAQAHLIAASAGTLSALTACIHYPHRIRTLVLIGPTLGDAANPKTAQELLTSRLDALTAPHAGARTRAQCMAGPHATRAALETLRNQQARIRRPGYESVARLLATTDGRGLLTQIHVPTLVLVGTHDQITGPDIAAQAARLLPHARLIELPGAGHSAHVEQPHTLASLIRQHVQ